MKTLIIYDDKGFIYSQMSGDYIKPQGNVQYLEVDSSVHLNKIINSVNVKTKELIMEDAPKTETQLLQEKIKQLESDIADLMFEVAKENK